MLSGKLRLIYEVLATAKKSAGVKSGEYGGSGMIMVLFLANNSRTSIDV